MSERKGPNPTDIDRLRDEWRYYRSRANLTQKEAGGVVGIAQRTVSSFEQGNAIPRRRNLQRMNGQIERWRREYGGPPGAEKSVRETRGDYVDRTNVLALIVRDLRTLADILESPEFDARFKMLRWKSFVQQISTFGEKLEIIDTEPEPHD